MNNPGGFLFLLCLVFSNYTKTNYKTNQIFLPRMVSY